ncbi:glycoside hydrolase family 28 protein [Halalkalibacter krulwichiae]|uniref:Polygalacturonase n=1 Tax=Halalkalibacter krulwichiae TaxID=199441 RepID=A0A1X9MBJ5_9BACI|nr:glycoside hydrolase family 28 protein [Halalkalibacter krulwichiae]ARK29533.1 Polygalacturonase [Halalkalibacter krulwichiae]
MITENQEIKQPIIPKNVFHITDFGAIGNGMYDNTNVFQVVMKKIQEVGGGKVIVPAGIWLTGPIQLVSKLNLHFEDGAILLFSSNFDQYPLILSSFEGEETIRCRSPLDGEELEDVAITGSGVIDGSGSAWRPVKRYKMTEMQWEQLINSGGIVDEEGEVWWPSEQALKGKQVFQQLRNSGSRNVEDFKYIKDFLRPNLVSLRRCKRILLDGPTFQNSPAWCVHPWVCEQITIKNITVRNPWFSQNGDGLDVESSRFGLIEDCIFDVGDDAICIKSGKDEAGRLLGVPCEHITIRRCQVYSGHGGFVIGSEMSGGVRDITISDCSFFGTDVGLRFKSTRGRGGVVENIYVDRITMNDIKNEAIVFQMFYELEGEKVLTDEKVTEKTPIFRNITITNVLCTGAQTAIKMKGLPEMPLQNINFTNITISSFEGICCSECVELSFSNVKLNIKNGPLTQLENCKQVVLDQVISTEPLNSFLNITGNKNITVKGERIKEGDFVSVSNEVDSNELKLIKSQ